MQPSRKKEVSDLDVRHFIYTTFAGTSRPPTTLETADHFKISIAAVERAYERLANAHHIALAPGSHGIWMAHPFSGLLTNYVTEIGDRLYWGN
jgi:DNA-binding transcriptional MocR family regulator